MNEKDTVAESLLNEMYAMSWLEWPDHFTSDELRQIRSLGRRNKGKGHRYLEAVVSAERILDERNESYYKKS